MNSVLNRRPSRAGVNPGLAAGPRQPFLEKLGVREAVPTLILIIGATLVALPLLWMFSTSLRPSAESYKLPPQWLPTQFHWENYGALFNSSVPFLLLFFNSLKITTAVTIGQLIFCASPLFCVGS